MPLLNYFLIIIGIPIVLALTYDLKKKYNKNKIKKLEKIKSKESQWDGFILDKYNEMKIWNPDIEYDDVKEYVLKSVKIR
jgi:hypothetical protein